VTDFNFSWINPDVLFPFDPRFKPLVAPDFDIDECPYYCIRINTTWWAHFDGVLQRLMYNDAWEGTLEEKEAAVQQVQAILKQVGKDNIVSCGTPECCDETKTYQINDAGQILESTDGTNYTPSSDDPRDNIPELPPITMDETHTKCDAAVNIVTHMQDNMDKYANQLEMGQTLTELVAVIMFIIFTILEVTLVGALLTPLLILIAAALIGLDRETFQAYFTTEVWDQVRCVVYCSIGDDGRFNDSRFALLISKLRSNLSDGAGKGILIDTFRLAGRAQTNNYASTGASSGADCSDCDCTSFCDYSAWEIHGGRGTIIDQDASGITVQASLLSGSYWVDIDSGDVDTCCCNITFENVVGVVGDSRTIWYNPCGLGYTDDTNLNFSYSGQSANRLGIATDHPFTVRIFSTGDCA
jgi:hypothetical protein